MRKELTRKMVWLGLVLCIIASMLAFACGEPEPEAPAPTPVTPTPTPEEPAPEKPTLPTPTAPGEKEPAKPTAPTAPAEPFRILPYGGVYDTMQPERNPYVLRILARGLPGGDNLGSAIIALPFWNPTFPSPCIERLLIWDETGLLEPYLAKSWEWSADRMSITMNLQEGVKFHDGTDFNAEAVKFNLDRVIATPLETWLKTFESIDVIDDYTIRINLEEFDNTALYDLAATGGIMVSPTALQLYGEEYMVDNCVGTGAYKFVSREKDVDLIFTKNPDWWQGEPFLDGIEYYYQADSVTAKLAFLAGEGDMLAAIDPIDAVELEEKGFVINSCIGGLTSLTGDGANEDSVFHDIKVRKAICHAVDAQTIADAVGYGFYTVANQPSDPVLFTYNPDVVGYEYDPAKAKELLAEAGYPDGFKTKLTYGSTSTVQERAALIIQEQLAEVGIELVLDPAASGRMREIDNKGWENGFKFGFAFSVVGFPQTSMLDRHYTSWSPYDVSRFHHDDIEGTLIAARQAETQEEMIELLKDVIKNITDTHCVDTPLYMAHSLLAQRPYLHGGGAYDPWASDWRHWTFWMEKH
jgi:peptide/nickel transport system substrate-binding protein